jgi:hypothetical protein
MKYKFILNLCMNDMVWVSSTMWRIKNQPSNSISCSDNALRLLVRVAGILIERTYIFIFNLELHFEGLFLGEVYFEGPNCVWRALKTLIFEHWFEGSIQQEKKREKAEDGGILFKHNQADIARKIQVLAHTTNFQCTPRGKLWGC